jgi:hypothetical protein
MMKTFFKPVALEKFKCLSDFITKKLNLDKEKVDNYEKRLTP